MIGLLGIALLLLAAFTLCDNRKAIRWRTVGTALGLQVLIARLGLLAVAAGTFSNLTSAAIVGLFAG
jgi:nucleoside permease NupC